ncbi:membrane protein [Alteromonas halophila]|uniref:Membrane protein n=2 Tax=Alteromonas halophila TaxID=516698 RepID=A0A918MYJ1_9ALTE|nr:membrane protein [Alteromonas halophila]
MTTFFSFLHPVQLTASLASASLTRGLLTSWVTAVLIGQWLFAAYITVQFAAPWATGALSESTFSHMIKGHVAGDNIGNAVLLLHILPVMLISMSGVLQLIPYLRQHFPRFHRLNGRLFLTLGLCGALTGLWLTWGRDTRLSNIGAIGITLNGLLIPIAVAAAWYYARKRDFKQHSRFAIHAFILINGVWSFRLMLMGWYMVNQGPNGNNATIDGPADLFMSFACYLLPMAIAEVYFWSQRHPRCAITVISNSALLITAGMTAVGVFAAGVMMWWPRIAAGAL